eukprot:Clim_evm60s108 gene=Clim_evmTU60s108
MVRSGGGSTIYGSTVNVDNSDLSSLLLQCDLEPIHILGAIQNHGALIAIRLQSGMIGVVSENLKEWVGVGHEEVRGRHFADAFGTECWRCLQEFMATGRDRLATVMPFKTGVPNPTGSGSEDRGDVSGETMHDVMLVVSNVYLVVEVFGPTCAGHITLESFRQPLSTIFAATELQQAYDIMAEEIKQLSGFDRVMVYKFDEHGNGCVVAEAKEAEMEPYLGLNYPASDIPRQARRLYCKTFVRVIADVTAQPVNLFAVGDVLDEQPFDLSMCSLRAVSPMHIQYLKNMGVGVSMSFSIIKKNHLWGLIACHNRTYKKQNLPLLMVYEMMSQAFSLHLLRIAQMDYERYLQTQKQTMATILSSVDCSEAPGPQIEERAKDLMTVFGAGGMYCRLADYEFTAGECPKNSTIKQVVNFVTRQSQQVKSGIFQTNCLSSKIAVVHDSIDVASGVLALHCKGKNNVIVFFRPEVVRMVSWGGNPNDSLKVNQEADGGVHISPRRSFAIWKENMCATSKPWTEIECREANQFRLVVESFLKSHEDFMLEKRLQSNLSTSSVSSDSGYDGDISQQSSVKGMLGLLVSEDISMDMKTRLNDIVESPDTMLRLLNDILDMSKMEENFSHVQEREFMVIADLQGVFTYFEKHCEEKGLTFDVQWNVNPEGNHLVGDPHRIRQVVISLLENAHKFTFEGGVTVKVKTSCNQETRTCELSIAINDTGCGIPSDSLELIFQPFKQAQEVATKSSGGNGLGLTMAHVLSRTMGGKIAVNSLVGSGSTFTFSVKLPMADDAHAVMSADDTVSVGSLVGSTCLVAVEQEQTPADICSFLEDDTMQCDAVTSPVDLVHRLQETKYDIVLVSVHFQRTDVEELRRKMQEGDLGDVNRETPLVCIALNEEEQKRIADQLGGTSHVLIIPRVESMPEFRKRIHRIMKDARSASLVNNEDDNI